MKYKNLKLKGYIHHRKVYKPHFRKLNMENEKQNENENELTLIKEMGLNLNRINRNKEVLKKHNRVFVNGYINKNMIVVDDYIRKKSIMKEILEDLQIPTTEELSKTNQVKQMFRELNIKVLK